MALISGIDQEIYTETTAYVREPSVFDDSDPSPEMRTMETDDYSACVHRSYQPIETTTFDSDGLPHTHTLWEEKTVVVALSHPQEEPFEASVDFEFEAPKSKKNETIWQKHQQKIRFVLNTIAQNELRAFKNYPYNMHRTCLGHAVLTNSEIKGKKRREKVRKMTQNLERQYQLFSNEYETVKTHCKGVENNAQKFLLSAKAFHKNDHKNCNCFRLNFGPYPNQALFNSKVHRCFGHVEHLYSFPENARSDQALRLYSDQKLKEYQKDHKNFAGYLATHTFERNSPHGIYKDLFMIYQHRDNHSECRSYLQVPSLFYEAMHQQSDRLNQLNQIINKNASQPQGYLDRSFFHLEHNDYEGAVKDFKAYQEKSPSLSKEIKETASNFGTHFLKGLWHSAANYGAAFVEFSHHPLWTLDAFVNVMQDLTVLTLSDDWDAITEMLLPGVLELAESWRDLSSEERAKQGGYIFGKLGGDFFIPYALAKGVSAGVRGAEKALEISNRLKTIEKMVSIEAAAAHPAKGAQLYKQQMLAEAGYESGLSVRELYHLKESGQLDPHLANVYDQFFPTAAARESFEVFQKAESFLKPFRNKMMPEAQIKELIHQTGIKTFPRPEGIPGNFQVHISKKGAGIMYVDPKNAQHTIRVMPGKPHSGFPHQQNPYVIHRKGDKALDKFGVLQDYESPSAHIPLNEFFYLE